MNPIKAHGGKLVNRIAQKNTAGMFSISISEDLANDVENIADGIFSPLEGFLVKADFDGVISKGRLANDLPWTVPIVLNVDKETAQKAKDAGDVALKTTHGEFAVLHVEETYTFDKTKTSQAVYGTTDIAHPGVAKTNSMKEYLIGGKIDYTKRPGDDPIRKYRLTPTQTRQAFSDAGWKSIAAFQTRNPPHVAHEMLQKESFLSCDGVFVNPLIGKKKSGDFVDEVILESYIAMINNYYPKNRCSLATLHTEMRYAGPKEAIHHAIMRQNYGCTNIIIGRDHAGVGKYYSPFAAQEIFSDYPDLDIKPLFFPAFYYCKKCLAFTNERACPHSPDFHEQISGTKLRSIIDEGQSPSEYIMRPEVVKVIQSYKKPFVE
ncbi:sulfate adenylyltransferase [Candidatus Nitrosotenuis cloacae]|uniref:sulfate adenylyltransferase n=1 Tax=Candidatus Nitrosotenuis cloacae TaxID=1603555 RepID=A0A3G1B5I7_9ARCH|nr:sulfate adenylyltransferase [Candidatus Nitrosotenuis cloacae]AJZ76074.1 sulfate adenylyltransferase [Candidatus Nitrosotenuis cloacae]